MPGLDHDIDSFIKHTAEDTPEKPVSGTENHSDSSEAPPENHKSINVDDFEARAFEPMEEKQEEQELSEKVKDIIPVNPDKEAKVYVTLIDSCQRMGFTIAHKNKAKKRLGGNQGWEKAQLIYDAIEAGEKNLDKLTPEEKKNFTRLKKTWQKIDRLKLDSDEREMLTDALSQIVAENGYRMPPGVALAITGIYIAVPRFVDLMTD